MPQQSVPMIPVNAQRLNQDTFIDYWFRVRWKEKEGNVVGVDAERRNQGGHSASRRENRF